MKKEKKSERARTLNLQKANLAKFQIEVGATDREVKEATEDAECFDYIREFDLESKQNLKRMEEVMEIMRHGDGSDDDDDGDEPKLLPAMPVFRQIEMPHNINMGIIPRLEIRKRRFRAAPGYTAEIGKLLGIEKKKRIV